LLWLASVSEANPMKKAEFWINANTGDKNYK